MRTVSLYEQWSDYNRTTSPAVSIFYASAYGNTRKMAEAIAEGASKHAEVNLFDAGSASVADMRDALESSRGIIIGSCTINGDALEPIWDLLSLFALINKKGKTAAAFGSYGWSGEAVGMLEARMQGLRLKVVESGLKANFVPTEADLEKCRGFGEEFAKNLAAG
jgi:flavorubredoxin